MRALIQATRPGGEVIVNFYKRRGPWTRLHAKHLLRPITRRMSHRRLESLIDRHLDRMIAASRWLRARRLGHLARFLPLVDMRGIEDLGLAEASTREWARLDTFDMFSPRYDEPQAIPAVARIAEQAGARVTFAGRVPLGAGTAAVVRAIRR